MRRFISFLFTVAIIGAAIVFAPKLLHTCDDCDKFFVGTGYEPNIVEELVSEGEVVICKDCAEKHHAISIAMGKTIKEYERSLFDDKK